MRPENTINAVRNFESDRYFDYKSIFSIHIMEAFVEPIAKDDNNIETDHDQENRTVNFKEEEITTTAAESIEPITDSESSDGKKVNSSENAEEIIVVIEPSQVLEVEVPIAEINSNLDNCDEKEADAVEENSSQSIENCEINLNADYEPVRVPATITSEDLNEEKKAETPEEIVKKILSAEKINEEDLKKRVLLTFETDIVDLISKTCQFDESKLISDYHKNRLIRMVTNSFPKVKIDKVEKLSNKYLYAAFMLKKNEKKNYRTMELIHSTAAENVSSIERENLDWRRVYRAKYGKGVSFSSNADYANYHSSWSGGNRRAFVLCDVLAASETYVDDNQKEAPEGKADIFKSRNGHVYVKFDDFTIYPKYALYYDKPPSEQSTFYRKRKYFTFYNSDSDDGF